MKDREWTAQSYLNVPSSDEYLFRVLLILVINCAGRWQNATECMIAISHVVMS